MKQKVGVITLGCSKNLVDSEKIAAQLNPKQFEVAYLTNPQSVDVLIINTCGFILDAKTESIDTILQAIELKKRKKINQVIVTGCLLTRYFKELRAELPEVDKFFTVNNFTSIADLLNSGHTSLSSISRKLSTPSHYAYLKIAEGCNRKCSFCAIPKIRGKYHSEPIESLYQEALLLARSGVKELILVAQDLTYYGMDIARKPLLSQLIRKLSSIPTIEWIRLHYTYPQFFTQELINEIADNEKVCKYIDIPIQHISNRMLSLMKRKPGKEMIIELLNRLRKRIPGLHLRTTVLVGHPGETKRDFEELLAFIKEFEFEKLGAFAYSHEENTYSAKYFKDNISRKLKQERLAKVMEVQQAISQRKNEQLIGSRQKVIIDREESGYFIGRTQFDSPEVDNEVLIKKSSQYTIGNFYSVTIKDAFEFDLMAE